MNEEIEFMNSLMEEMAGDKEERGKRRPGERGMYEIQRMKNTGWEFNTDTQEWETPEVVARRALGSSEKARGEFKSDSGMEVAGEC